MRQPLITALSVCALGAFAVAQGYRGEGPFIVKTDLNPAGLDAASFKDVKGAAASQVQQIHTVLTNKPGVYYATATVVIGGETRPWSGYLDMTGSTPKLTPTDDVDAMNQTGRGEFQASTDKWVADATAEGGGHPNFYVQDSGSSTAPVWGKWDAKKGVKGQFVEQGAIKGAPSGYVDAQLLYIDGKLLFGFVNPTSLNIEVGDFNTTTGAVTNVRVLIRHNTLIHGAGIHSHTGVTDQNEDTHAVSFSDRNGSANSVWTPSGDPQLAAAGAQETYTIEKNPTVWTNNPAAIGGTNLIAQSSGYNKLWRVDIAGLASEFVKAPGTAKILAVAPYENTAPQTVQVFFGLRGKAGIPLPPFGNVGLDAATIAVGPQGIIPPKRGFTLITIPVPAGVFGTLEMQAIVINPVANKAWLSNNAQLVVK